MSLAQSLTARLIGTVFVEGPSGGRECEYD